MREVDLDLRAKYLQQLFCSSLGEAKLQALSNAASIQKDRISISPYEGHLISFLLQMIAPKRVIEFGTLTGHSALWIIESLAKCHQRLKAKANGTETSVPDPEFWSIEKLPQHYELAKSILTDAASQKKVNLELRLGDATEIFDEIENTGPFCAVFIDANKAQYLNYLAFAERALRPGGLLIADNVFLANSVYDDSAEGPFSKKQIEVMRKFNRKIASSAKFNSVILPTTEGLMVAQLN